MTPQDNPPTKEEIALAQLIWNYSQLNHPTRQSDIIVCLGSIDTLPAERAADLYLDGWSNFPYLVFTGKGGRNSEKTPRYRQGITEARMLAEVAMERGVPEREIILEEESTNTGDNIRFTKRLLEKRWLCAKSMTAVHMPSSQRRDFATILKAWPEIDVVMACPRVPMSEYQVRGYQGQMSMRQLISDMLGDFQRTYEYPKRGFMVQQDEPIPKDVLDAYNELAHREGYDEHLLKDDQGKIIEI